ncbi:MAG: winged helix-turn-helix domain-containing protein [Bacteroidales bacterium]
MSEDNIISFRELDPLLHSQLRLAVMSLLISLEEADFVYLREKTGSTAGNLSVQIEKLTQAQYIEVDKGYSGKKPRTTCRITPTGRKAFEEYLDALRTYTGRG